MLAMAKTACQSYHEGPCVEPTQQVQIGFKSHAQEQLAVQRDDVTEKG